MGALKAGITFKPVSVDDLKFKKDLENEVRVVPPKGFVRRTFTPWKFQAHDLVELRYKAELEGGSANWNDMGLGKTTSAIWHFTQLKCKKVLIITTKTGKTTYFETLPHIRPDMAMFNLKAGLEEIPTEDGVYLAHYNLFQYSRIKKNDPGARYKRREPNHLCQLLLAQEWDMVILDEAHRIKSREAQCTKNIRKLKSKYRHIMTGTGFINDPSEVWQLLNWLNPNKWESYWGFRNAYCNIINVGGFAKVKGIKPGLEDSFRNILRNVGVRHSKAEVFPDLPEKYYKEVVVDLNPTQARMYKQIVEVLEALDQGGTPLWTTNVLSQMARLRQISAATPRVVREYWDEESMKRMMEVELEEPSSKLDALMEILEDTDEPIVVFSEWRGVVKLALERFKKAGISYVHLRSEDSDEERAAKVQAFQSGRGQVFISTLKLGSESITVTRASTVVFLDRSWSPKDNKQAEDRLHRPGQKNAVEVIDIVARHTIDNRIKAVNKEKNGWFAEIFGKWLLEQITEGENE